MLNSTEELAKFVKKLIDARHKLDKQILKAQKEIADGEKRAWEAKVEENYALYLKDITNILAFDIKETKAINDLEKKSYLDVKNVESFDPILNKFLEKYPLLQDPKIKKKIVEIHSIIGSYEQKIEKKYSKLRNFTQSITKGQQLSTAIKQITSDKELKISSSNGNLIQETKKEYEIKKTLNNNLNEIKTLFEKATKKIKFEAIIKNLETMKLKIESFCITILKLIDDVLFVLIRFTEEHQKHLANKTKLKKIVNRLAYEGFPQKELQKLTF